MTAAFESIANICCCCFGVLSVNMLEGVQHVGPPLSHCFTCKCQAIDKTEERWNGLALLYIIDLGGQSLHILQNMKFSFSPEEVLSNTLVPFALTLILKPTQAQIIKSKPQTDHGQVRDSETKVPQLHLSAIHPDQCFCLCCEPADQILWWCGVSPLHPARRSVTCT